jgi:HlyD family secretion protein
MTLQSSIPAVSPEQSVPGVANGSVPADSSKGAPIPKTPRMPRARRGRRTFLFLVPATAVALVVVVAGVWFFWFRGPLVRTDLVTAKVEYKDLQLKVVERGSLEAIENHDIKCEVKAGSRGAPKIQWVVNNGDLVKKGDLLVDIDDSYLKEQATNQKIARDKAEADKVAAEQLYPLKKVAIALAEQNLEKWKNGEFPQTLHDYEGQIQQSESALIQQHERTSWVSRMVKKGYMTVSQEESEKANLRGNELDLQKKQEQRKVLTDFTDPYQRQTLQNAIQDANNQATTAYSDMESKRAVFAQQDDLYKELEAQIKQCKVYAPSDGIVVYATTEQTRMGAGATQSIIAQGEPVQFGQKMMSIPDLAHMQVNVRIHEAFINHMRGDDLKASTKGLPATVRVDAASGKTLKAHVKSVANVAAPQDWMSPDVKVYQAYVEIDESVKALKLKPGLSAVCTILTDEVAEKVLAVPVQAVLSPLEKGGKPRCFVATPSGPEARPVDLGMTDEKYVEIKSGLDEGEEVILNPRALLSDKEKKGAKEDDKIVPTGGKPGAGNKNQGNSGGSPDGQPKDRK